MDVGAWLRGLGLGQYEATFRDNEIDSKVLPHLTAEDLKDLGVSIVGHRRAILTAIAELSGPFPASSPASSEARSSIKDVAERRQVTVMFVDLVGSTALSARMDPEDVRDVISAYHKNVTETVQRFDGFVAKYMGDGVLAYFGYPKAHEDDAERAVRSSLRLVDEVPRSRTGHATPLQVRIGIATGLVVIGDLIGERSAQERAVVGETPNLAARLQALGEPNQVIISHDTRRLTAGLFEYRDLGGVKLKGLNEPVQAWQVLRSSTVQSRFEAQHETSLTPLVGREEELELLLRRWRQAAAGGGRVVILTGEPGIGKSRLVAALQERLGSEPNTTMRFFCSSQHTESALFPVVSRIERAAGFGRSELPSQKLEKLEALLARSHVSSEAVALIAGLLSVPVKGCYSLPQLSPQRRKEKLLEALLAHLAGLAAQGPLLAIFEDVHWIDPTSLELLEVAVERAPELRLLLVITARTEFSAPWPNYAHVTNVGLNRLSRREASAMIDRVTAGKALPAEVLEQILLRTDGVPLFVEELTKTVLEGGLLQARGDRFVLSRPMPPLAIPTTLHASLMARLDRSTLVKEIAQIGAAIGREFSYALLRAVAAMDEAALKEALSKLEEAQLASCHGKPPEATYSFKHALVQDTAYTSLVRSRRKELHRQIAEALRDRFPALAEAEPGIIAHHFAEAGLPEPAIEWWGKAGEQSLARSAITEASSHLKKAIGLAEECGALPVKDRLRLQISYGQALMAAKGYGAVETTAAFARARALASGIEDASERFSVYYGLWVGSFIRGELAPMQELAAAFLGDVEKRPGLPETANAHRVVGLTRWFEGHFRAARAQFERAVAESDTGRDHSLAFRFGQDPGVASILNLAIALGPLGDIGKVHELLDAAWTQAQQGGHIPTIAYTHGQTCLVEGICRDVDRVRPHACALTALSREHGLQLWIPVGSFFDQWVAWREGRRSIDLTEMRSALAQFRIGFQPLVPLSAVLLAEVEGERGEPDAALSLPEELLQEIERTGQRWFDAEVHRQRGKLLLQCRPFDIEAAEAAFQLALATARGQCARTFELRAAIDLARLWRDQGKRDIARDLVAPVFGGFSKTFGTRDLEDAQTLLEELA